MTRRPITTALCLGLLFGSQAPAINIITNYNAAGAGAVNPTFDLGATQLDAIFNAVEAYYEDIFEDGGHTLTINFWYADLTGGLLGDHDYISADLNNRENVANIQIDTNVNTGGALRSYFYDNTPTLNEEFNMTQTLWRDIGATNQSDWYNFALPVPDTFEVGFTGTATSGLAVGNIDMFSLVLHEVGHALGMSGASPATQAEASIDQDYDFNPNFIFGATLAADTVDQPSDFLGHLDGNNMLMFPSLGGAGTRKLPSHTDILAMAASNQYLTVDAPRREFYGGSNWNNAFNWTGSRAPDSNDDAYVRDSQGPGTVINAGLSANGTAQNLFVSEGANVDINSFRLTITQDVFLSDPASNIFMDPGGELLADEVFIQNQAGLNVTGGTIEARRVVVDATSELLGLSGGTVTIDIEQGLVNDGTIRANSDAHLIFTKTANNGLATYDLDGVGGNGVIHAQSGDISFQWSGITDTFNGTMIVNAGHFIELNAAWTFGAGALMDLNGGSTTPDAAEISMPFGTLTFNGGTVDVDDISGDGLTNGIAQIDASVVVNTGTFDIGVDDTLNFLNATSISGGSFNLSQGASLNFNSTTTVIGGTFNTFSTSIADGDVEFNGTTVWRGTATINGLARQDGPAFVSIDPATINADVFDMDGNTGAAQSWTLSEDLTVNADAIDTNGNTYNGTINVNDAFSTLTINTPNPWTLAGTLNVTHAVNSANTSIAGQDFTLSGTANIDAWTGFDAKVNITGTINLVGSGNIISLRGSNTLDPNTINGGGIYGDGTLSLGSSDGLVGNGIIGATGISLGLNARLLARNGQLFINSAAVNSSPFARIGTDDPTGTLFLNGVFDTSVVQAVELDGGGLAGDNVINNGLTVGHGGIITDGFNNRGTITASNGTLNLSIPDAFTLDLDGTNEVGVINALAGTVRVTHNFAGVQSFDGTLNVGNGYFFRMEHDGLRNAGTTNLTGGNIAVPVFQQADTLNVSSLPSSITANDIRFEDTGTSTINANLFLAGTSVVEAGATLTGSANLVNSNGFSLQLMDGVQLDVDLVNEGTLQVGNSPGTATVNASAEFGSASLYNVELGGSLFNQYDRLLVTESIDLDGTLRVVGFGGFIPTIGDAFQLINATTGVTGVFSNILLYNTPGVGLCLLYDPNSVYLVAALPGDLNLDGFVGIEDLNIVLGLWNQKADPGVWAGGDPSGDGFVGIADLNTVLGNWNTGTPPTPPTNTVPEPATLPVFCFMAGALLKRVYS
jgi:uncharacterized protein (AIM24 family)